MSPAVVLTLACHFCSKHHFPYRTHRLGSGQLICDDCMAGHFHALDVLAGAIPQGCQECGVGFRGLAQSEITDEVRMYVVPKDGILQTLCKHCAHKYTKKRPDLYHGTDYGRNQLKI